ncbi:nonstructural polyprotein [Plautia stali intestine virus]|uniref:Nonstructural polyprotein n=1 Tax=Plautia stali intestine virus TaxID=64698 RepID=O36184_9VIRU|nr:nonstructural polyprotein [Plautia stali intestine virus]BAA21898.1 nonstructural polyprotein [Plautia stali intestine virus]
MMFSLNSLNSRTDFTDDDLMLLDLEKPVTLFDKEIFRQTLADMDGKDSYSYYSIERMIFEDLHNPYLGNVNHVRKRNFIQPIKRWYDMYNPVCVSFDRKVQGYGVNWPHFLFLHRHDETESQYNTHHLFRSDVDLVVEYERNCVWFDLSARDVETYSFILGLPENIQYNCLDQILDDRFTSEDLFHLIENLQFARKLPLVVFDGKWRFQQPHLSLFKFIDNYISLTDLTKFRLVSHMERVSSKFLFPQRSTVSLCSDGTILVEDPYTYVQHPQTSYNVVPPQLNLQSSGNILEDFIRKYETELRFMCGQKKLQGINITHKIDKDDLQAVINSVMATVSEQWSQVKGKVLKLFLILVKFLTGLLLVSLGLKILKDLSALSVIKTFLFLLFGMCSLDKFFIYFEESLVCQDGLKDESQFLSLFLLDKLFLNGCPVSMKNAKDFVWFVSQAPRFSQGITHIVSYVKDLYVHCEHFFRVKILGLPSLSYESPVCTWIEAIQDIYEKYKKNILVLDARLLDKLFNLYKEGNRFLCTPAFKNQSQIIVKYINLTYNLIDKVPISQRGGYKNSLRPPPVSLLLLGGTGRGKTTVTFPLTTEVATRIYLEEHEGDITDEDIASSIYARNSEQEYWDGYTGQLITVFDDFMQRVDSASNPNLEIFEMIRASNIFPYPLHMANLEDKNNTWFRSSVILASSNLTAENLQSKVHSLNYPVALLRRFDLVVEVEIAPGCTKPRAGQPFSKDIYKFTKVEYILDESDRVSIVRSEISYDEIVKLMCLKYKDNMTTCQSVSANITEMIGNVRKQVMKAKEESHLTIEPSENNLLATQGWLSWFVDSYEEENDLGYDNFFDEVVTPDQYIEKFETAVIDITPDPKPDEISADKERTTMIWRTHFSQICEEYPIVPYLATFGLVVTALGVGYTIYRCFFNGETTPLAKSEIVLPKFPESQEKEGVISRCKIESQEKIGSVSRVRVESQEKLGAIPHVKIEQSVFNATEDSVNMQCNGNVENLALQNYYSKVNEMLTVEGCSDQNAAEILSKVVCRNYYALFVCRPDGRESRLGHILFLKDKIGYMPQHFLFSLRKEMEESPDSFISLRSIFLRVNMYEIYICDFLNYNIFVPENDGGRLVDSCLVDVETVTKHPDILTTYVSQTEVKSLLRSDVCLPFIHVPESNKYKPYATIAYGTGQSQLVKGGEISSISTYDATFYFRQSWKYKLQTASGTCGAPVILIGAKQGPGRICGMHVMGDSQGNGYAVAITRELLCKWINDLNPTIQSSEMEKKMIQNGVFDTLPFPGKFISLGDSPISISAASKTQLRKSVLYGEIAPVLTKPTWLTPGTLNGEVWDPRNYRLSLFGRPRTLVKMNLLNSIKDRLVQRIYVMEYGSNYKYESRYPFETACEGIDSDPTFNSIKRKTSAGYPLCSKVKNGKQEIFGSDGPFNFKTKLALDLRKDVEHIESLAMDGISSVHVFIDTLKDERKAIEKAHKTRLFSASPLPYLILCRMYLQGGVSRLIRGKIVNNIAVGTNPYSDDWTRVAHHLLRNRHFVAGDFASYDSSQEKEILRAACEVIVELCEDLSLPQSERDKHRRVRWVLLESLLNSVHYSYGKLYYWSKSLPSGHFLTSIINSIFVNIAMCYAFVESQEKGNRSEENIRVFFNDFSIVTYGDDHVIGVPEKYVEDFNQLTLPKLLKTLGLDYTMEDKDRICDIKSRKLEEVTFIKRSFRYVKELDRWLAPLDLNSILDCMNWQRSGEDEGLNAQANVSFALKELSLHPEDVWDQWFPLILRACNKHGVEVEFLSRHAAFQAVRETDFFEEES